MECYQILNELVKSKDRKQFICSFLEEQGIEYITQSEGDISNVISYHGQKAKEKSYIKHFVAHYDVVPGSPGANDNGASVAILLNLAQHAAKEKTMKHIGISFVDKEERMGKNFRTTGSYALAKKLRAKKNNTQIFFVLDVCGNGDSIIINKSVMNMAQKKGIHSSAHNIKVMRTHMCQFLSKKGINYHIANCPASDDLPIVAMGIPAILLSVLPEYEALRLLDGQIRRGFGHTPENSYIPKTWLSINGEKDTIETVNPDTLTMMCEMINDYALERIPLNFKKIERK